MRLKLGLFGVDVGYFLDALQRLEDAVGAVKESTFIGLQTMMDLAAKSYPRLPPAYRCGGRADVLE